MNSPLKDRARLIRKATPNILEVCFEMQNRICDLCNKPIQDLILAALDHSIPVIHFARSPLPIDEAVAQANDSSNLRAAHSFCNKSKLDKTREQWFAEGLDKRVGTQRVWTEAELAAFKHRMGAGGRIQGRKNVESGQIAELGRIYGPISGNKIKESGHLASIATFDSCSKGGRIGGRKNVESGQLASIASKGSSNGGRIGMHKRWHINRSINPNCLFCITVQEEKQCA